MKKKVGIYSCQTYDVKLIEEILERALQDNTEWLKEIKQGTTVFLKLNLLLKKKPEEAVTTHPALVEAVVRVLQKRGARVIIGDSPGGPYIETRLRNIYRVSGLKSVADKTGAELNEDVGEVQVAFPEGEVSKSFPLMAPLISADFVISLPKLKTHMMTKYTGAVKNLFGTIPGLKKVDYHLKMPKLQNFCDMLIDLALCIKPVLHIMDAVWGMEGNGPSGGNPRKIGAVLISQDPFALDVAALSLVGIEPLTVPTVERAKLRGLPASLDEFELVGDSLDNLKIRGFLTPKISGNVNFPVPEFINRFLRPKPVFIKEKCRLCGECVQNCPPKALVLGKNIPEVNLALCIRCFCCQELCPHRAVVIKRNLLGNFLGR